MPLFGRLNLHSKKAGAQKNTSTTNIQWSWDSMAEVASGWNRHLILVSYLCAKWQCGHLWFPQSPVHSHSRFSETQSFLTPRSHGSTAVYCHLLFWGSLGVSADNWYTVSPWRMTCQFRNSRVARGGLKTRKSDWIWTLCNWYSQWCEPDSV